MGDELQQIVASIARPIRGCATDEQYREVAALAEYALTEQARILRSR